MLLRSRHGDRRVNRAIVAEGAAPWGRSAMRHPSRRAVRDTVHRALSTRRRRALHRPPAPDARGRRRLRRAGPRRRQRRGPSSTTRPASRIDHRPGRRAACRRTAVSALRAGSACRPRTRPAPTRSRPRRPGCYKVQFSDPLGALRRGVVERQAWAASRRRPHRASARTRSVTYVNAVLDAPGVPPAS